METDWFSNINAGMSSLKNSIVSSEWDFYKIVICIAIIILIISLVVIGHYLRNDKSDTIYPPVLSNCPDYWEEQYITGSNDKQKECVNKSSINNGVSGAVTKKHFNDSNWKGNLGLCTKQQWAIQNGLVWDGITNNPKLC